MLFAQLERIVNMLTITSLITIWHLKIETLTIDDWNLLMNPSSGRRLENHAFMDRLTNALLGDLQVRQGSKVHMNHQQRIRTRLVGKEEYHIVVYVVNRAIIQENVLMR